VSGRCTCALPTTAGRSSAWRALTPVLVAALMPKCPMCLFGLLAAVGVTGVEDGLGLDPQVLMGLSIGMLASVVVWFAVRRGALGAVAATLASVAIFGGKHVFSSTALVVVGLMILATYVFGESFISRVSPSLPSLERPGRPRVLRRARGAGAAGRRPRAADDSSILSAFLSGREARRS
jgi:hypothetical protein